MVSFAVVLAMLAAAPSSGAAKERERDALRKALTGLVENSPLKNARVTIQVKSLDDGSVVFAEHADELLNPASNVKLFTAATALSKLGADYRFDTEFLTDPDFRQGKTKTLYVRGKGDPSLNTEKLYGMVSELVHLGLKEVSGDLWVDDSFFDAQRDPPGFDQESGDRAYLAPTGALSLNWNAVGVYLRPADGIGQRAAVEIEPASEYFNLDAAVMTGTKAQRHFNVSSELDKDKLHQKITARGFVPAEKGSWSVWKKIDQPALYFGFTLKAMLEQRGIKVRGRVKPGTVPTTAKLFYLSQSDTLDLVLKRLNKVSSNFVAEQLIKTLGAEGRGLPGSTEKGIAVVEEFLDRDVGLPKGSYVMRNGSGLNDTNRFSAAQTVQLLKVMVERFPLAPEYLSALGIAGKDGTIKYRFEGSDAVGRLRAKTGTLENVSALSGYVQAVGGERFAFSIMVNDFLGRASNVVQHIDALGAAVASSGSVQGPSTAVAKLLPPTVLAPQDELKARLKTYAALVAQPDKRQASFLRTGWRNEKDPAVRAALSEALYQCDPRESAHVRIFLDSVASNDDVFGRLTRAANELGLPLPLVPSLLELAASGNSDAIARWLELSRVKALELNLTDALADGLATIAEEAPNELLRNLKGLKEPERDSALDMLARGLVRGKRSDSPWWEALKTAQGSVDPSMTALAKSVEVSLSQKIAQAKAPPPSEAPAAPSVTPSPSPASAATGSLGG